MVSLPQELQEREAAARRRVDELQARMDELALRLEKPRDDLSRFVITRKTVAEVLAESARGHPQSGGEERGGRPARAARAGRETQPQAHRHRRRGVRHRPAPRRPHEIIHPPGGRTGTRPPRPGPKAARKWVTASVIRTPNRSWPTPSTRPGCATRIICGTGSCSSTAPATNSISSTPRPPAGTSPSMSCSTSCTSRSTSGRPRTPSTRRAAGSPRPGPPTVSPRSWPDTPKGPAEMTTQAEAKKLPAARREQVTTCHGYLTGHLDQLHYATALKAGWPIATGAVESACRHLIADRLDITGARWGLTGAEAILQLRAPITNGDFDNYWIYHAAQKHRRLYLAHDQQSYDLTTCPRPSLQRIHTRAGCGLMRATCPPVWMTLRRQSSEVCARGPQLVRLRSEARA